LIYTEKDHRLLLQWNLSLVIMIQTSGLKEELLRYYHRNKKNTLHAFYIVFVSLDINNLLLILLILLSLV